MSIVSTLAFVIATAASKVAKPLSYVCPACRAESFNPNDIRERYCGRCHVSELETQIDNLRRECDQWRYGASPPHNVFTAQMAQGNQGIAYGALSGFQQAQAPGPFHQLQAWHDCTCVPGRGDLLSRL